MEDLAAYVFALVTTVGFGSTWGMFLSLGLSMVLIIQRISLPRMTVLGELGEDYQAIEREESQLLDGILVVNIVDSLFFGNAGRFKDNIHAMLHDAQTVGRKVYVVVLDLESVLSVDSTGLTTLREINSLLEQQGVELLLAGLQKQVFKFVTLSGISKEFQQHLHLNTPVSHVMMIAHSKVADRVASQDEEVSTPSEKNPVGVPAESAQHTAADSDDEEKQVTVGGKHVHQDPPPHPTGDKEDPNQSRV